MRIGPYQVLLELARGGMGKVYLAQTLGPGGVERLVAIKRAHEQEQEQETGAPLFSERLVDEACMAAHVHHSNVVGVHQAGSDEGGYYLVLDYVEGESLNGLLDAAHKRKQRLPPQIVLRIACDALAGLHAAHEATDSHGRSLSILHRDVSTQNLLVGRDGVTRLTDFGIAKSAISRVVTAEHYVQGKLVYMAPEYLAREPVDRTIDVYAMGMTLWMALTGKSPWPGIEEAQLLHSIVVRGVPSFVQQAPELGAEIAAVVDRACHLDAAQRFRSAREMLDALETAAASIGGLARHVEVAEFVESLVGRELSERRKLIKARRDAMTGADDPAHSEEREGVSGSGQLDLQVSTEGLRRRWEQPLRWHVILAVVFLGVAPIAVIVGLEGRADNSSAGRDVGAAPKAGTRAPTVTIPPPPPVALPEELPPVVATKAASSEPRRSSVRPSDAPRRSQRTQRPSTPKTAPFSTVNPYR